jgi:hypothetical protein
LDEKIAREGFDKVLREDLLLKPNNSQNNSIDIKMNLPLFYGQSSSVRRIHKPDGVSNL